MVEYLAKPLYKYKNNIKGQQMDGGNEWNSLVDMDQSPYVMAPIYIMCDSYGGFGPHVEHTL